MQAHPEGACESCMQQSLEGGDQPHEPGVQEVNVHVQELVAGAGHGQLEEVKADAPQEATWGGAHVLLYSSRKALLPVQVAC